MRHGFNTAQWSQRSTGYVSQKHHDNQFLDSLPQLASSNGEQSVANNKLTYWSSSTTICILNYSIWLRRNSLSMNTTQGYKHSYSPGKTNELGLQRFTHCSSKRFWSFGRDLIVEETPVEAFGARRGLHWGFFFVRHLCNIEKSHILVAFILMPL